MKKRAPLTNKTKQDSQITTKHRYSNSLVAQRERLLTRLKDGAVSTIQARHELDIIAPAPRIYELRHDFGYNIATHWQTEETPEGHSHRIASYVLLSGKFTGSVNL